MKNIIFKLVLSIFPTLLVHIVSIGSAQAGYLGDFTNTKNDPGYLTLDTDSRYYSNPLYTNIDKSKKDGIERRSVSEIVGFYFNSSGKIDPLLIEQKRQQISDKENAAFLDHCQDKKDSNEAGYCFQPRSSISSRSSNGASLVSSWKEKEVYLAFQFIQIQLTRALELSDRLPAVKNEEDLNKPEWQEAIGALVQALEVEEAVKDLNPINIDFAHMTDFVTSKWIDLTIEERPEALNLVVPNSNGTYFNPESLKKSGYDLSLLNPRDSGLWRQPRSPISEFDTTSYNLSENPLGTSVNSDTELSVDFEKPSASGTTPKMKVRHAANGKTSSYKLKFALKAGTILNAPNLSQTYFNYSRNPKENQTEFVANNLAAALGFTVDPTYYIKNSRVYLLKETTKNLKCSSDASYSEKFETAYKKFYFQMTHEGVQKSAEAPWDFSDIFSKENIRRDENGCNYIPMKGVSLEKSSDYKDDIEIGTFVKYHFNRNQKREFRALQLFYAWINDVDAKDSNAEIKIVKDKVIYSAADMGASFGFLWGRKNLPNWFNPNLVDFGDSDFEKNGTPKKIVLNYKSEFKNPLWDAVSINDAKWFARLLGQLTYKQIRSAFDTAEYPPVVAEVYTQKLLRRRDQLIQALGLVNSTVVTNGKSEPVKLVPLTEMTDPKTYRASECPECFTEKGDLQPIEGKLTKDWTDSIRGGQNQTTRTEDFVQHAEDLAEQQFVFNPLNQRIQRTQIEKCVFFDGISLGVDSFIPAIDVIQNPNKEDKTHPFWGIEIYRTGFDAGYQGSCHAKWGLSIDSLDANWKLTLGKTFEVLRITPLKTHNESFKDSDKIFLPKNNFASLIPGLLKRHAKALKPNQFLIYSQYDTKGAALPLPLVKLGGVAGLLRPEASGAFDQTKTKRMILSKDTDGKVLANWENLNKNVIAGDVYLRLFILRFPLFGKSLEKLKSEDLTYKFDLNDQVQARVFEDNIGPELPTDAAAQFHEKRTINNRVSRHYLSLLGYNTSRKFTTRSQIRITDKDGQLIRGMTSASRIKRQIHGGETLQLEAETLKSTAYETIDNKFILKINSDYKKKFFATVKDFAYIRDRHLKMLPRDFITYDNSAVEYYLGPLKFEAQILVGDTGLRKALSITKTENELCEMYFEYVNLISDRNTFCKMAMDKAKNVFEISQSFTQDIVAQQTLRTGLHGARNFIAQFKELSNEFIKLKSIKPEKYSKQVEKVLNQLVQMIENNSDRTIVGNIIIDQAGEDQVLREAFIETGIAGLPGQKSLVELNSVSRGNLQVAEVQDVLNESDLVENVTDYMMHAVSNFFYDFTTKEVLVRTLNYRTPGKSGRY